MELLDQKAVLVGMRTGAATVENSMEFPKNNIDFRERGREREKEREISM